MDAASTAPVVWIAPARDPQDRHALDEWALARGVRLVTAEDVRAPEIPVDLTVGERVENELDRARDALTTQEAETVERALARAEALLYAHPELPQAAWLMAEVHRVWSARWHRLEPRDPARGDAAWQRAATLDGGRVAGIGEIEARAPTTVHATIELTDATSTTTLRLDGAEIAPGPVARAAGEHHLTVMEGGAVRAAMWVALADRVRIVVPVPLAPPCSSGDLAQASAGTDGMIHGSGTRCRAWVAVVPAVTGPGSLGVASCSGDRCGPLVEWRTPGPSSSAGLPSSTEAPPKTGRWPTWATVTLFGAGIIAGTAVALAATGAFDKQRTETRFVNGGIKVQGF